MLRKAFLSGAVIGGLAVALRGAAVSAGPMNDGFTFTGHLQSVSGLYYGNGVCDFQVSLHDMPSGGTQIGASETVSNVPVQGLRFTVDLNAASTFGPTAFKGDSRWLAVATRCASASGPGGVAVPSGPFSPQPVRFPLKTAPFALWAKDAGVDLSGLWNIKGNSGTDAAVHFLGTTDAQPLAIRTDGVERMRIDTAGRVGIGTGSPAATLHVSGGNGGAELILAADADDSGEADQAHLTIQQDGGAVNGRLGYFGGTDDLRLVNGAGGAAIVLKANGEVCIGSGC